MPIFLQLGTSGTGGTTPPNFSYKTIASGAPLTVPLYQEMSVYQQITINDTLTLDGDLVLYS